MDAERVIEWVTQTLDVVLTWNQEQLIRNHCEARKHGMVSTDPGREFAVALVDAYRKGNDGEFCDSGVELLVSDHTAKADSRMRGVGYCDACLDFLIEIGVFDG